jgi:predicted ester cyclase
MTADAVVRALVETVWNGGRAEDLDRFFASTFDHNGRTDTPDGLRAWHTNDAAAWADSAYEIVNLVVDGEQVAMRWQATARHVGQWGPVPPTGITVTWQGAHFFTVRDERIIAMWAVADTFGKAVQLGVRFEPPTA